MQKEMSKLIEERENMKIDVKKANTIAVKATNQMEKIKVECENKMKEMKNKVNEIPTLNPPPQASSSIKMTNNTFSDKLIVRLSRQEYISLKRERENEMKRSKELESMNEKLRDEITSLKTLLDAYDLFNIYITN